MSHFLGDTLNRYFVPNLGDIWKMLTIPFSAVGLNIAYDISKSDNFCIHDWIGDTPTDVLIIIMDPVDRGCTPWTQARIPVNCLSPGG